MGLKVWLPLDGDLHNQGCSNPNITLVSGNTWASSGKIGNNSLTLTKLQTILPNSSCMSGAKEVSYCYWVKVNTAWSANWLDGIRWIETDGSATSTARQEFYTNCTLIGTWYKGGSISGKSFTPGIWAHLAATINYNTGEAKFYINGTLSGTTTNVNTTYYCRGDFYIGDNGTDICENDVRIYDHCLSAAEVREISQGLILHYKLDDITNGVQDSSGYNHNGTLYDSANITINNTNSIRYENYCSFGSSLSAINAGKSTYINSSLTYNVWARNNTALSQGGGLLSSVQTYGAGFKANEAKLYFSVYDKGQSKFISVYSDKTTTQLADGEWHMYTGVYNEANKTNRLYIDGVEQADVKSVVGPLRYNTSTVLWVGAEAKASQTVPTTGWIGDISDVRIYVTALSQDDIMQLYQLGAKVDNKQNLHAFELNETTINKELLSGIFLTPSYGNHTTVWTNYDNNNEITLTGYSQLGSPYISINPTGHTYYYDIEASVDVGNAFYVGFHRYDAQKTNRSNNACVYVSGLAGGTGGCSHKHFQGTINLSTDGVNPTAYISLRVLNDWSKAGNKVGTIHKISLREITTISSSKINKNGQLITDELVEYTDQTRIQKNGMIYTNNFIEI